ncbi:alpha/beta hydrolase [Streptomyces sp. NPDC002790]|uniref:alpha/beta fold hydrolase n=1 Tax=Streptomyces sp. NPDC002790 TaxID=3154431 RepID=UPI00332528A0
MAESVSVPGGTIAYEDAGAGPLVVLAHGLGDSRAAYRFVLPHLVEAGYRVAAVDLRGCGKSSAKWPSYSRTDIAGDLLAVIRHIDCGPAVLVGHSISGGAATIVAAQDSGLVRGIIELGPFTRAQSIKLGEFRSKSYRTGALRLLGAGLLGSVGLWTRYLDHAYPGRKPADWTDRLARIEAMLGEPGRMRAMQKMAQSAPTDADAELGNVRCPALIVQGSLDPDWVDPRAEGRAIVAAMPAGVGELAVIEGAGHYPHDQYPEETVSLMLAFLEAHARA